MNRMTEFSIRCFIEFFCIYFDFNSGTFHEQLNNKITWLTCLEKEFCNANPFRGYIRNRKFSWNPGSAPVEALVEIMKNVCPTL
ncbi:hypothetical protein BpHYR1_036737 [Brachionus plicatilis]|uniref:Uncharacterized protein n=1 Tax=Brachionus plicatilis TaxID=10195 RepID=A0A3M7PGZ7_BRAPC|nr:hypothetical protein BpHYR1_036737 [Brachionus plicatilis]